MMPVWLDTVLVLAAVLFAAGYLVRRKIRSVRRLTRDWTTGHAEVCDSCPVMKVREAKRGMRTEG